MSETRTLNAEKRERAGKGGARAARRAGLVPAVIYGAKKDPVTITLEERDIVRELFTPGFFTHLFDIKIGNKKEQVLARDVQLHPVKELPLHVDFLRVSAKSRVSVEVPVHFINDEECKGIKVGGVLNVVRHTVELDCSAANIPEHIEIDLTGYDVGDSIHISEVSLPDDVAPTISDRDFTIATIAAPSALKGEDEEEEGEEDEAEEGEGAEEASEEEGSEEAEESSKE
ncbi:MAG: 50S ribosomal protein L25/general stress protein Ctc [Pseudomonadota bacterium]|uniref:50S ribosomal protein L25/general stress protein Ctc n=1 Tax=Fodinicurvata fenggangensis TaxID=1121830 RepID=UPI00047CA0E0|nr:50S ribosomal protein L25/general stress protein Ctc [Fodinicurvata fenggangensis]